LEQWASFLELGFGRIVFVFLCEDLVLWDFDEIVALVVLGLGVHQLEFVAV
jgi:hypothetical protein